MSEFVPPFPARPKDLTGLGALWIARRNLLACWQERSFSQQLIRVRILARRIFVCNSPDLVQYAFQTRNEAFERKSPQMRHALEPLLGDGLFISDGATWRRRRRIVAPIIHTSRLREFAPVMVETVLDARDGWAARGEGAPVDALAAMAELTAEIICRTIFGRELGRDHAREIVEGFTQYQRVVGQLDILSLLGLPDWLPRLHGPRVRRATRRIHAVLDGIIDDCRRGDVDAQGSVIGHLLEATDEETGRPLDREALRNEAAVIFMAGHETTANTLAWVWFLLSQSPDVEARLHAELDAVLAGRVPGLADAARLPYTRAVIDETLRLYPPVPYLAREALADETLRDRPVPKGSLVMVVPWLLHRHKHLWDAPDAFRPERFLEGSPEPVSRYAYVPFSIGPRICAGLSFALAEAILCLATLAQSFRLRLEPGHVVEPVCRLTLRPGDTLPMRLHRRHPARAPEPAATTPAACPHLAG